MGIKWAGREFGPNERACLGPKPWGNHRHLARGWGVRGTCRFSQGSGFASPTHHAVLMGKGYKGAPRGGMCPPGRSGGLLRAAAAEASGEAGLTCRASVRDGGPPGVLLVLAPASPSESVSTVPQMHTPAPRLWSLSVVPSVTASVRAGLVSTRCFFLSRPQHPFLQRKRAKRPRKERGGGEPEAKGRRNPRTSVSAVGTAASWCCVTASPAPRPITCRAWVWASGPSVRERGPSAAFGGGAVPFDGSSPGHRLVGDSGSEARPREACAWRQGRWQARLGSPSDWPERGLERGKKRLQEQSSVSHGCRGKGTPRASPKRAGPGGGTQGGLGLVLTAWVWRDYRYRCEMLTVVSEVKQTLIQTKSYTKKSQHV